MSCFALVTVSPFNPDLIPMDFYLADGVVGSVTDSKPPAGLQPSRNLNQALSAPGEGASHNQKAARIKGNKSILQEDVHDRLVEDIDAVLWKMVGVGELQSQGFTQTRPFSNPSGELASGNTVSPNEGYRRSPACCLPASQPAPCHHLSQCLPVGPSTCGPTPHWLVCTEFGRVPRNVWTPECSASPGEIHQPQTHPKGDAIPGKKWC
ncbi:uncharacterized protein LOC121232514 isoform X2 [Aquila chrysaetos chrysaetos]|uniref:uncharacterized protein LOC121232514 isoform X2 n=1 Tax=Aquila chrysaetos chrysaetos TaxID=223781 RepID=UPI001B7D3F00|nr:uncharacterized protein LOC121232514 isoform X2 [Aquila chrysaetos chrysaetos]